MVELQRISITKADLDRIPADERFFYLMAGQLANDGNILGKLLIGAFNTWRGEHREEPRRDAGLAQTFLLLKLLAGRLHEANSLIGSHYFSKRFHTKYESHMSKNAVEARRQFSGYFGGNSNIITPIRQKFAFHFGREEIDAVYDDMPADFLFIHYLGEYIAHTLFYGSEIISLNAMATVVGDAPTALEAIDRIYENTTAASRWLTIFVIGFMQVMITRYIGPVKPGQFENVTTEDELSISRYTLPFFFSPQEAPEIGSGLPGSSRI
jgi:hypothetical protein